MAQLVDTFAPLRRELDKFTQMNLARPGRERSAKLQNLQIRNAELDIKNKPTLQDLQQKRDQAAYDLSNTRIEEEKMRLGMLQADQADKKGFSDFVRTHPGDSFKAAADYADLHPGSKAAAGVIKSGLERTNEITSVDPKAGAAMMSEMFGRDIKAKGKMLQIKTGGNVLFVDPRDNYKVVKIFKDNPKATLKEGVGPEGKPGVFSITDGKATRIEGMSPKGKGINTPMAAKKEIGNVKAEIAKLAEGTSFSLEKYIAADNAGEDTSAMFSGNTTLSKETKDAIKAKTAYIKVLEKVAYPPEKKSFKSLKSHYFQLLRSGTPPDEARKIIQKEAK